MFRLLTFSENYNDSFLYMEKMEWSKLLSPLRLRSSGIPAVGSRSNFEQDFDRIVFSQPFRKLQDKTQVFPLPEDDFVHTRLTHSLEVSRKN